MDHPVGRPSWQRFLLEKKLQEIARHKTLLREQFPRHPLQYRMTEEDFIVWRGTDGYLGTLYEEADRLAMRLQ